MGDIIPFFDMRFLNLAKMQIPTGRMSDTIIPFIWFCVAAIGVCVFRCADFGWRTFCMLRGKMHGQEYSEKNNRCYRCGAYARTAQSMSWQRRAGF